MNPGTAQELPPEKQNVTGQRNEQAKGKSNGA
jgi:hypothetical protein